MPGKLQEIYEFFRDYKIPDGKPANTFAFEGKPKDRDFAVKVITECHNSWKNLIEKGSSTLSV